MTKRWIATSVVACMLATPALAKSEWLELYTTKDGAVHYVDAESLKMVRKDVWRIWLKTDADNVPNMKSQYAVRQVTINCIDENIVLGAGVIYNKQTSDTVDLAAKYESEPMMPDTLGGLLGDLFCKRKAD